MLHENQKYQLKMQTFARKPKVSSSHLHKNKNITYNQSGIVIKFDKIMLRHNIAAISESRRELMKTLMILTLINSHPRKKNKKK